MYRVRNILEAPSNGAKGGGIMLDTGTHYVPFAVDTYSSSYGYHLLLKGVKGGLGNVEISVEEAVTTEQETWTEILTASNFGTAQAGILDAEMSLSLGLPSTHCYKPCGRLKVVVPANAIALLKQVYVTGGTD